MLVIRLKRVGRKHQPSYRLVVAEKRSKLGGPPAEDLGPYNPSTKTATFAQERIRYWLGVGAKPTPTVHNLLVKQGVVSGPKIKISIKKKELESKETAVSVSAGKAPETPAEPAAN
ncbi:MAG: 30S ribosomal protein S16 [Candidatus Liptonbacteria bacterium]|nr:30S ribosomal protein S16 [Candidatus Liptonbacteria bacterium]